MNFVKNETKLYTIHAKCDCGGEFKHEEKSSLFGDLFWTINKGFRHKCNKCGKVEMLDWIYPFTAQQEVGEEKNI